MGTKQMTLLEKAPTRVPGQSLLQAELLACPPWDHLSLLGWLSQAGRVTIPTSGDPGTWEGSGWLEVSGSSVGDALGVQQN